MSSFRLYLGYILKQGDEKNGISKAVERFRIRTLTEPTHLWVNDDFDKSVYSGKLQVTACRSVNRKSVVCVGIEDERLEGNLDPDKKTKSPALEFVYDEEEGLF